MERIKLRNNFTTPNAAPAVDGKGTPWFDNPNGWTEEQVEMFYNTHLRPRAMAFTVKWMGLQQHLNNGPYEAENTRLEENRNG